MADTLTMLEKVKLSIRRSHNKLDSDLQGEIDACMVDLRVCGVVHAADNDPLIVSAVKLYCRAMNEDDIAKSVEWMARYEKLKACLMMAEGYGWKAAPDV